MPFLVPFFPALNYIFVLFKNLPLLKNYTKQLQTAGITHLIFQYSSPPPQPFVDVSCQVIFVITLFYVLYCS